MDIRSLIRDVPDFPKAGILFKDITPLLGSFAAFEYTCDQLAAPFVDQRVTKVAAIESRGFIFGAAMARLLRCGFVPIRKPGKLPWKALRQEYELEYGTDALEIHQDALSRTDRVLIVDDVLATGGTAAAADALLRQFDCEVIGCAVVVELLFLDGRRKLSNTPVHSLLTYE